jgi:hypothetical protein
VPEQAPRCRHPPQDVTPSPPRVGPGLSSDCTIDQCETTQCRPQFGDDVAAEGDNMEKALPESADVKDMQPYTSDCQPEDDLHAHRGD